MRLVLLLALFVNFGGTATFHFAIVGDRTGRAHPEVYAAVWEAVRRAHPDFAVTVGDAIEGFEGLPQARLEWDRVKRAWPEGIPIYHTPGNHDVWSEASQKLYEEETGRPATYSFDFERAHFVVLDNSRTDGLPSEQMAFLQADLQKHRQSAPTFVFFHRNFWLLPLKLQVREMPLLDVVQKYGVCCVVSGHGHQMQSVERNGREFLEIGSSGADISRGDPDKAGFEDGWFYQYCWVTVSGTRVTFEVRELGSPYGKGRIRVIQAGTMR